MHDLRRLGWGEVGGVAGIPAHQTVVHRPKTCRTGGGVGGRERWRQGEAALAGGGPRTRD